MNVEDLSKLKELLDNGAITQQEYDNQKKAVLNTASPKKKSNVTLIVAVAVVLFLCAAIIGDNGPDVSENDEAAYSQEQVRNAVPVEFSEDFPIGISASMYDNIIGMPELKCTFDNKTDKDISAIKLYFEPRDVYGESVSSVFTTSELYTDDVIPAHTASSTNWQMLDQEIKSGDIYVYSIYFSDGTQWGNKDAATSDVKKYGFKINAKY